LFFKAAVGNFNSLMIRQLFRSRSKGTFQARSSERDGNTQEAVRSIAVAIDLVLQQAEAERAGSRAALRM
jgi:hypothetical protein